ncbi:MAG: substrate-binding domain-containing protein [Planctomycetales bacterium]|nr:substrate-binding domain-containing protein [Planctomycetales bacterium]
MQDRKPLFWFAAVIALALAAYFYHSAVNEGVDPNSSSTMRPRLALIVGGPDAFWQEVVSGAKSAAEELDAELDVEVPDGTGADQTATLVKVSSQDFDGVAISPLAPEDQTRLISKLAAETKMVTYDNDAPKSLRHSYIGTNNVMGGRLAAELLQKILPEGGEIAIFIGDNERQNARDRRQSFVNALSGIWGIRPDDENETTEDLQQPVTAGNYQIVATYLDNSDPDQATANAEQALADHPSLRAMIALYGYNGPACLKALKKAGKLNEVAVIAFDEHDATLAGIESGTVAGTVVQDPYLIGYKTVEELCKLCRGNVTALPLPGSGSIALQCMVVDKENLGEFKANLEKRRQPVE